MKKQDEVKLDALNKAVTDAIQERREWLDKKMAEYAEVKIGEDIYDLTNGVKLGPVSGYYRYWRDQHDGILDKSLSIEYKIETSPNCFDNTSRYGHILVGTKKSLIKRKERELQRLNSNL